MWKRINESQYEVSDKGEIRNIKTRKILKQSSHHGYKRIGIDIGNGIKTYFVHRIVAENYIERVEGKEFINHINSDRSDNRVENLEWCTIEENNAHAYKNNNKIPRKKKVIGTDIKTGEKKQFESLWEAGKYILKKESKSQKHINSTCHKIVLCCNGKQGTSKGYTWEFLGGE